MEIVNLEHAYCFHKDDVEIVSVIEDPLRINDTTCLVSDIKIEIKSEPESDSEQLVHEDESTVNKSQSSVNNQESSASETLIDIKIEEPELSDTPDENITQESDGLTYVSGVENVSNNAINPPPMKCEVVPTAVLLQMENKCKSMTENYLASNKYSSKLAREKATLKSQVANLKKMNNKLQRENNSLKQQFDKYKDVGKLNKELRAGRKKDHTLLARLEDRETVMLKELDILKKKNMLLGRGLWTNHESNKDLETTVKVLRALVDSFMKKHKISLVNLKKLKDELNEKIIENRKLKSDFSNNIYKKLCLLKSSIFELRDKLEKHKTLSDLEKVKAAEDKRNAIVQTRGHYLEQIRMIREELNKKITRKDHELSKISENLQSLKTTLMEKEQKVEVISEKHFSSIQEAQTKINLVNANAAKVRKTNFYLKIRYRKALQELTEVQNTVKQLNDELQLARKKSCEYCGL